MKKFFVLFAFLLSLNVSRAVIVNFDLSPPGKDNAVGLSPLNETPPVTNSLGAGNEIGSGITFDTDTMLLSLSVGYGSAFGFTNLTGPATAMHIHGPAPVGVPAPVLISLATNHVPATNPANGGFIGGTVTYSATQAVALLAGLHYVNIHTATNPAGEIRGQLIPINTPPTIVCPASGSFECDSPAGRALSLTAQVADADGNALTVVWTVDGTTHQTNSVPGGIPPTSATVTFAAQFGLGQHSVLVSVSDGIAPPVTCSTSVTVVDMTPPTIVSATATPNVLWPPNNKFVRIVLNVVATDLCGPVTNRIKSVTSNESVSGKGKAKGSPDWLITGRLGLHLRAERLGGGNGRVYAITIESTDAAGNSATRNVLITVPHDQRGKNSQNGNSSAVQTPNVNANPQAGANASPGNSAAHGKPKPRNSGN